jgi:hypothetical protein
MAASMAARWHRPATATQNCGQASASHAPPPERRANNANTSRDPRSTEVIDELTNPRHSRSCARAGEERSFTSTEMERC